MHASVLLKEAVEALAMKEGGIYIDATFGRGGHSQAILAQLPKGRLIVIDKDPEAIAVATKRYGEDERVRIYHASFADITEIARQENCFGKVDGILMDLGVSSPQLDDAERGFSFLRDGPLDMRMNTTVGMTASEYLAQVSESELATVLKEYGEERFAKRIARNIVAEREETPIIRTKQLADLIAASVPVKEKKKHPATRSFQALRIKLNAELTDLESCLTEAIPVLNIGGRLCLISFHSLEDRLVKQFIRKESRGPQLPPGLPVTEQALKQHCRLREVSKAIRASDDEVGSNRRARSAIMRVVEKLS